MKSLFHSIFTINKHLKKLISEEAINSFDKSIYQGDNANYCVSLFQDNLIDPNENIKLFLSHVGQSLINWSDKKLHNGYFKMEDVHHGSELFIGFLPRYIDLFPEDQKAKKLLINVSEYIGNWRSGSEDWFDYEKNNFKSWYFGTNGVHQSVLFKYNTADHLRLVHIALLAWEISGETKYLKWSIDYSREFAKKISQSKDKVPVAWNSEWKEFFSENMLSDEEKFLAANHHHLNNNSLSGTENLLASGAIFIFGYLYEITKEEVFFAASKNILKNLLSILKNPYSDVVGIIFDYYRFVFADDSFDNQILSLVESVPPNDITELMLGFPEEQKIRMEGIGNRKDMLYWYNLKGLNPKLLDEPPTSFFTLAYNITGELKYAERALKTASRKITIASSLLRAGYEHADSGKLFCSIVSGHGRNWGVGTVTGCYSPLLIGSNENLGLHDYIFKFRSPTISRGCFPMVRKLINGEIELFIYNVSNKKNEVKLLYKKSNSEISLLSEPNSVTKKIIK